MRVLATALAAAMLLAGCSGEADFSGSIETVILPAEEYQREIMDIDRLVFRQEPLGEQGVRELEDLLAALSKRVRAYSDMTFIKLESMELQLLAKRAGRLSPRGTGNALQNDWMRLRNNLFDDRWWFARSAADLEAVSKAAPAAPPPPAEAPAKVLRPAANEFEPRSRLAGKWQVVSITANGKPREDEELTGSTWTFDAPRLVMQSGDGAETVFNFTEEGAYLHVQGAGGEDGWMLYELDGGELRVAFYDGLGAKPPGLAHAPSGGEPLLLVVRLAGTR